MNPDTGGTPVLRGAGRFLALFLLACAWLARADEGWPQFRGPGGQGVSDATNLPLKWSEAENVRWKTAIHGKAWSTPVILENRIWLTTASEDGKQLFVLTADPDSGKILRDLKLFDVETPQFCHTFNSYASPSPVIEPGRVYVTFGSPGTACLDTSSGQVIWQRRDFVCNHFRGAGSSPLLYKNLLIMHFDGSDNQFVVALDKATGKTVWQTKRSIDHQDIDARGQIFADGDYRKAFSTPRVATFDGKPVLVSLASKALYAYEPDTGKELWRLENRAQHSGSSTPVFGPDMIYFCTGWARGELWAVKPGGSGLLGEERVLWKVKKNAPNKPSPVLHEGLLYMPDDSGIATCVDAKTGAEVWRTRLAGNCSASPIFAAGRVYFFTEKGNTTIVAAGRQLKILAQNSLDAGFMACPAVLSNSLVLRTKTDLYRIEGPRD